MTESITLCECCSVYLSADEASRGDKLCGDCRRTLAAIESLTPSSRLHVLAAASCPDKEEIARRIGCGVSTHVSGVGNAATRTKISRSRLVSVARWAIVNGKLEKPEGFEDCIPDGSPPIRPGAPAGEADPARVEPTEPPAPRPPSLSAQKPGRVIAVIEGIKLITCDVLPGVRPPGHWERVLSAFMEGNEPKILLEAPATKPHSMQSALAEVIRRAKLESEVYATVRQGVCHLVRIERP
ncbi:MAG: hypothetical protein JXA87_00940 [Thermoleophilia bacterium]|nr:hypothetical protein [Thermoleophilia bacterium]